MWLLAITTKSVAFLPYQQKTTCRGEYQPVIPKATSINRPSYGMCKKVSPDRNSKKSTASHYCRMARFLQLALVLRWKEGGFTLQIAAMKKHCLFRRLRDRLPRSPPRRTVTIAQVNVPLRRVLWEWGRADHELPLRQRQSQSKAALAWNLPAGRKRIPLHQNSSSRCRSKIYRKIYPCHLDIRLLSVLSAESQLPKSVPHMQTYENIEFTFDI